jgi:hypothetical protein
MVLILSSLPSRDKGLIARMACSLRGAARLGSGRCLKPAANTTASRGFRAKQEAAAERLGLSFSTYRRHLTAGVDRLIEWLWQQEQEAPKIETAAGQTPGSASVAVQSAAPSTRPRLSIVILPFLNLSGDASVDYLVDGIVDSLITDLSSRLLGSLVI